MKKNYRFVSVVVFILLIMLLNVYAAISQVRIKDISSIVGIDEKNLVGYGLVMGLNGTGDGTRALFTIQSVSNMLNNMGITVDPAKIRMRNVAAVMVTAKMPPFIKRGGRFDVVVSSLGDARSIQGGNLVMTPLMDSNKELYAFAQGPVSIGGLNERGAGGGARENYSLVGRIPLGAKVEKDINPTFENDGIIRLGIYEPDFTTAFRIANRINLEFGHNIAVPEDAGVVTVQIPQDYVENKIQVSFIAKLEGLEIDPDTPAKVVVNERTGTVIVGSRVRLLPVAISHGNLTIQIGGGVDAAGQPVPAADGAVVVLDESAGSSVGDLAEALNSLKVSPRDMISIFQALKESGALKAELKIM